MRTIEKSFLKEYVNEIATYSKNYTTALDFVSHIDEMQEISLQAKCREFDYAFLSDITRIVSVIMSIVEHPHISSKREEIVSRIEQVKQLSNEDFSRSIRESSFWKKRGIDMIPERVYYYQQVDELLIYENKFICLLVNLLDDELKQYADLYLAMLPMVDSQHNLVNADNTLVDTMKKINILRKRISIIKNTRFFRFVSKSRPISRFVQKTNILIHDNLYKQCYRFYCKFMVYTNEVALQKDLRSYYLTIALRTFNERGFNLSKDGAASRKRKWIFDNPDFKVSLAPLPTICAFRMDVTAKRTGRTAKHLLIVSSSIKREDVVMPDGKWDSVDVLSLWNLVNFEELNDNDLVSTLTEKQLIAKWIQTKTTIVSVTHDVYLSICPVCKGKVEEENEEVYCENCHSKYKQFQARAKENKIWFINIRRS